MKIATFNCNSVRARRDIIREWLNSSSPDILCLQETKAQDADFPADSFGECGYHSEFSGQKSYNGVAILSKTPPDKVFKSLGDGLEPEEQARFIRATFGGLDVVNTYVPQGFEPGSDKFVYKLQWLERLREYFAANFTPASNVVWLGDVNVAPDERDVYDPKKLAGQCGFHPDEQAALARIMQWGFEDIFRKYIPEPGNYTFWDYRMRGSLSRNLGWRIDHINATAPVAGKSVSCYVDLEPRKAEKPSDHTFLIAEFEGIYSKNQ